jgi:F-type H+-transporting ATPase subunit a
MAVLVFLLVHISGMIKHGTRKYFAGWVPHGVPTIIWPVVFALEFISAFAKPFSLTIRLFANMMAGHVIIFVFLGMVIMLNTLFVSPASVFFAVVMMGLEILFSAIQAYVFTVLTAMYISTAMNPQH